MPRGDPWTSEEEKKLLQLISDGKNILEISNEHDRTPGSIKSRVKHIAIHMIRNGQMIEEVCNVLPYTDDIKEQYEESEDPDSFREKYPLLIEYEEEYNRQLDAQEAMAELNGKCPLCRK